MSRPDRYSSGDPDTPLYGVSTERLELVFLPTAGGRLISLRVDGRELLWRNPQFFDDDVRLRVPRAEWSPIDGTFASWSNLGGSKVWPAPQGWGGENEWPGPPDEVLDAGAWTLRESRDGEFIRIELVSPDDPRTGLRITRIFSIPEHGTWMHERIVFRATGARAVTWAPWEVCQIDTRGSVGVADSVIRVATAGAEPVRLGTWWNEISVDVTDTQVVIPVQDVVAKLGFADATGSIDWTTADGARLALQFTPEPGETYPDGGSRVEVWMQAPMEHPVPALSGLHPDAYVAELEVLGPLRTLHPGDTTSLEITWVMERG